MSQGSSVREVRKFKVGDKVIATENPPYLDFLVYVGRAGRVVRVQDANPPMPSAPAGIYQVQFSGRLDGSDLVWCTESGLALYRVEEVRTVAPKKTGEVRIVDPKTGGMKGQKPERYDLLPADAMDEVTRVYGFGASKYDDHNWLKGYAWGLSLGALIRHVFAFMRGEDRDPESGLYHLAHATFHCLALMTFAMRGLGTDDRRPPLVQKA